MRKRDFNEELIYFYNKIKNDKKFSISRWGDGELMILENKFIDLRNVKNGEFRYDPNINEYNNSRNELIESYKFKHDNYYIGIACSCCVGIEKHKYMKILSNQLEKNLTWANIFVNSNYNKFIDLFIKKLFMSKDIIMVVNQQADVSKLPFNVKKIYYVGTDAWYVNFDLIEKIKNDIENLNIYNHIYLIAAGPFANILTYKLWKYNKNNTYIDIGSTLDVQMGMKPTRGYHIGADTLKKKCIW